MAGGNEAGTAAWARGRARPGAGASAARLTVMHSSRAVIRCKRDARRDGRMMDLLYLLSTDGHTILGGPVSDPASLVVLPCAIRHSHHDQPRRKPMRTPSA